MHQGNGAAHGARQSSTGRTHRGRRLAALATAAITVAGCGATAGPALAWNHDATLKVLTTLPSLHPERVRLVTKKSTATDADVFVAPKRDFGNWQNGPMILNSSGKLLWYKSMPTGQRAFNFDRQIYKGQPVLTWWQGVQSQGFGAGVGEIYNTSYQKIAEVKAGNGQQADLHEFELTPQGTALITAYKPVKMDLRSVGGRKNGVAMDNTVQEIDVATGKVLVEWHSAQHIRPTESYAKLPDDPKQPFDYVHMNSADIAADGNIVVSGRATHAYYKIGRTSAKFIWRMGGKRSDFKMGSGARTAWQHDVRNLSATRLTAFDNNAAVPAKGVQSRGVILKVDEKKRTVRVIRTFKHPSPILAASQGNMQSITDAAGKYTGHEMVGWGGDNQLFTEFDSKGKVVFDAKFLSPQTDTYRAFKYQWTGNAPGIPLINVKSSGDKVVAHMSWNGATRIATWRILGATATGAFTQVATVPWGDLETGKTLTGTLARYQAQALDAQGKVLGTSAVVGITTG
jgi:hypothetical protein